MKNYIIMRSSFTFKSVVYAVVISLFTACSNKKDERVLVVTGDALEVTYSAATLTGYARLPFEFGDAKVGIMYNTTQSFENGKRVMATELDGNNMFAVKVQNLEPATTYYYKSYAQNGMAISFGEVKSFCTQEYPLPDEDEIAVEINRVKNAAIGSWEGKMSELFGGQIVEVLFTDSTVATNSNFNANIKSWNLSATSNKVYVVLDDEYSSCMYVEVYGSTMNKMELSGDSTNILKYFPKTLTKQ